jgi:hypothetical protein
MSPYLIGKHLIYASLIQTYHSRISADFSRRKELTRNNDLYIWMINILERYKNIHTHSHVLILLLIIKSENLKNSPNLIL